MFLQQLVNGITIGSMYALVAIGYSMIFSVLRLINFSNGSMYMLGGYVTLMLYLRFQGKFMLALICGLLIVGLVGYSIDCFALRPLRKKKSTRMASLMSTFGIGIFIDNAVQLLFGSETKQFPNVLDFGSFQLGNAVISWTQVIIFVICAVLMALLSLVVYRTKIGRAMRSTAENVDAARLMGVDVKRVISATFIVSAVLATVAGVLVSMYYKTVDLNMSAQVGMKTFAAAVLGGVGVLPGAMVGGLLIGVLESLGASYISSGYRDAYAFIIMILVLLLKPNGLLGKQTSSKL